jgi:hypothetical protein
MLAEAISHYHELLSDAALARDSQLRLEEEMRARRTFFGERPVCTVLRPRLITPEQYASLQRGTALVATAARKVASLYLTNGPETELVRSMLLLTPEEERLIALDPGYAELSAHSRMDTFLTIDGNLQFVEYNAESPAGIAYEDMLSEAFRQVPVMHEFGKRYSLEALPARQRVLEMLLDHWREAGEPGGAPTIAILDWHGLPTANEFVMFQEYFAAHGVDAVICSPDELSYREGRLYAEIDGRSTAISIVFKRVLTSEFLTHYGNAALDHPLIHAYTDRAVAMVNSFRGKLMHKKSIFALLTHEAFQHHYSAEERAAVAAHVPWTRIVAAGETSYRGERVELVEFTRRNRERLLLKPNDEYGGKGITIGWESSADEWDTALKGALESPFVVQERVQIAYEPYPTMIDGQLQIGERLVDSDPYLFGSTVDGCLCRLSTVTLLNVTAGGGSTVPVFTVNT